MRVSHAEQVQQGKKRQPSASEVVETVREAIEVVAQDPTRNARLADAETACALEVTDAGVAVTFRFDRSPVALEDGVSPDAHAHISGPLAAWQPVFEKGNLGIAVGRGELEWDGPVREFLRVFPIVRTAYRDVVRGDRAVTGAVEAW